MSVWELRQFLETHTPAWVIPVTIVFGTLALVFIGAFSHNGRPRK